MMMRAHLVKGKAHIACIISCEHEAVPVLEAPALDEEVEWACVR